MQKNIYRLLPILILALGILLRGQETFSHNFLFLLDQGRDMIAVKNIIYDHHLTLIGPSSSLRGVFQGPLWYYLLSIPTVIFNGNPWGTVLLMLLISVGALLISYFWTRRLFGEKAAIITLFLLAVSPEAVAAATYLWNPHPMWFIIVVYIFSLYELVGLKKKHYNLILWPVIALMFHFQTALAVFILAASFIFLAIFDRNVFRQRSFLYAMLVASIFFAPQVLFELRHDFIMTKSVLNIFLGHDQGLFVGGESRNYLNLVQRNMSLFYYNFSTSFVRDGYFKDFPKLALLIIVGFLALQKKFRLLTNKEWNFISIAAGLVSIVGVFSFLYPFPLRYWFLTGFQAIYIVVFGLILSKTLKWTVGKIAFAIFAAFLLFYSVEKLYSLYISSPDYGGTSKIRGKLDALDYIYKDTHGESFGLLVFTPPVYTYPYDYLIWWYGKRKYNYVPYADKKGIFYLLIEPDSSKRWSYKGWLETVIKTGTILETKELPSGFIIQKRYVEEKDDV